MEEFPDQLTPWFNKCFGFIYKEILIGLLTIPQINNITHYRQEELNISSACAW